MTKYEKIGTLIAFIGGVVTSLDQKAVKLKSADGEEEKQNIILGDIISFVAACFGSLLFHFNSKLNQKLTGN